MSDAYDIVKFVTGILLLPGPEKSTWYLILLPNEPPEFKRSVIEVLLQPIEECYVSISSTN